MNIDLSKLPSVYCPVCGREAKLEQMTVNCGEGHAAWVGGVSAHDPSDWRLGMAGTDVPSWFKAGRLAALREPWRSKYPAGHVGTLRPSHQPPALFLNLGPETQVLVLPEHVEPVERMPQKVFGLNVQEAAQEKELAAPEKIRFREWL